LIRNVIYCGSKEPNEVAFRVLLFKTFNKIETWELLRSSIDELCTAEFSVRYFDQLLSMAQKAGAKIYSGAYILPSGKTSFGSERKHRNHLLLIKKMIDDRLGERVMGCKSLKSLYELLSHYPTIGPFLAFQYAVDLNYSDLTHFSESDFVVAGPGARSGIEKCFMMSSCSHEKIIRCVTEEQEREFDRRGLSFRTLWGRPLQLIDVQNLFCEVDKYSRVALPQFTTRAGRQRMKRLYTPNPVPIDYWFPPKWGINEKISSPSTKENTRTRRAVAV